MGEISEQPSRKGKRVGANEPENLINLEHDFPPDKLVHLRTAFDLLGRHRFGGAWSLDTFMAVRVGFKDVTADHLARGRWALKALVQCVENGWLPLIYYPVNRRIRYFDDRDGPSLEALYPQPTDEEGGLIELAKGKMYSCMVDINGFESTLRARFGQKSSRKRGPDRQFKELDEALEQYFSENPTSKKNIDVYSELRSQKVTLDWPGKTVRNERINEAKHVASMKFKPQI